MMPRWTIALLLAMAAIEPAVAADLPEYGAPYAPRRQLVRPPPADEDLLFTPSDGLVPYIAPLKRTPLLPGSSTLPGYYGSNHSYDYGGPYYGGPYVGYWNRLPYACGVYGYC